MSTSPPLTLALREMHCVMSKYHGHGKKWCAGVWLELVMRLTRGTPLKPFASVQDMKEPPWAHHAPSCGRRVTFVPLRLAVLGSECLCEQETPGSSSFSPCSHPLPYVSGALCVAFCCLVASENCSRDPPRMGMEEHFSWSWQNNNNNLVKLVSNVNWQQLLRCQAISSEV